MAVTLPVSSTSAIKELLDDHFISLLFALAGLTVAVRI
jgi:hypothetical protein